MVVTVGVAGLALWPIALGPFGLAGSDPGATIGRPLLVYGVLLVVTLLTPLILGPLGRLAGLPFALFLPAEARLSRGSLARDRKRTALTVGALTIGLAMIVALGGLAGDARTTTDAWLTDVVPGDLIATSIRPVAANEGVAQQLAAVPGVAQVSPIARFAVAFRGVRLDAAAVSGSDLAIDGRLTFVAGDRRAALAALDAGGSTIVPQAVADQFGLQVGDTLELPIGGGEAVNERIVGVIARGLPGQSGEAVLIGWSDATSRFGVLGADAFAVRFAAGQADAGPAPRGRRPRPGPRADAPVGDRGGDQRCLRPGLRPVRRAGPAGGPDRRAGHRQHADDERLRARPRDRDPAGGGDDPPAGLADGGGGGGHPGRRGCLPGLPAGVLLGVALGRWPAWASSGGGPTIPWSTIGLAAAFGIGIAMLAAFQPARIASRISIVRAVQFE